MSADFWIQHQYSIAVFCSVILALALSNLLVLRRLGTYAAPARWPRVSVLVPARNEEANIAACVGSLLAQDYPDFEVLVLDDHSTDATARLLAGMAAAGHLHTLQGRELPAGWLGKAWACQQLAEAATGEILLFTDADTRHHPQTLRQAVAALEAERADLLTLFVQEEVCSWAERLVVPILPWSMMSFFPLVLAYLFPRASLSATNGQFMLFRRTAYEAIGGHASVRREVVDDMALGRRVRQSGLRWRIADGVAYVRCRMYGDWREVFQGLGKNLFGVFGYRVLPFLFVWLWLGMVFVEPPVVAALAALGALRPPFSVAPALVASAIALTLWFLCCWHFRLPAYLCLMYPVIVLASVVVACWSLLVVVSGRATWKGRRVATHAVRWVW